MVGVIAFCVGGLVGAVISRTLMSPEKQKELEQSVHLTRQELNQYQQDVAQHFAETSKLVNNLTQSYKEVHEHLAKGAIQLTNAEISQRILAAAEGALSLRGESIDGVKPEPPKDWSPKTGNLGEDFGLTEDQNSPEDKVSDFPKTKTG